MSSPLWKRFQLLLSVLSVLLAAALLAAGWGWWRIRASLPQLDGERTVAGLGAAVRIERDALGVPTITGATRLDVARATGFLHAQDRFFQMDLLRRSGAGELAELFGAAALPVDRAHRLHGFRRTAGKVVAALDPDKRAILEAYAAGVNAGLAALSATPWEYAALRSTPRPWRPEDSCLVIYAMWFDVQDSTGRREQSLDALRRTVGQRATDFLAPRGNSWDAPLDGSSFPPAPLPPLRFSAPEPAATTALRLQDRLLPGSNGFAVAGPHTAGGAALLANDMHLNLNVPQAWYRVLFRWTDAAGTAHQAVGVTLPGTPALASGSNGRIAWGYTNAYVDTSDVISVETESTAQLFYRTTHGFTPIEDRPEPIAVRGAEPEPFTARWTEWGPILSGPVDGRYLALRWNAHDPECLNLDVLDLETAGSAAAAVAVAHRTGMPNQNLIVADRDGHIAWTLTGRIPRRVGYDGRLPVSWAYGDRQWDGWLKPEEIPVISDPPEGLLWTANQRLVGGEAYARLGDGGYDDGPRGGQIRDDLRRLLAGGRKAGPADLLAIQLDDRAVFLERWQKFFLEVLTDPAVAARPARRELRDAVRQWSGRADTASAAYRLVKAWRLKVADEALGPFYDQAAAVYPAFNAQGFMFDDSLWQLVHAQPEKLLNPAHPTWPDLLLAAADAVAAEVDQAGLPPARYTWGRENTLRMQHPFSRMMPGLLGRWLDMPAEPLPGGSDMPRVQGPSFGASERLVVAPGHEAEGFFHMPGGQCGNPLSPYYRAGHAAWVRGEPTPLLPGPAQHTLTLRP